MDENINDNVIVLLYAENSFKFLFNHGTTIFNLIPWLFHSVSVKICYMGNGICYVNRGWTVCYWT